MKILIAIPARGGSVRLARKNLLPIDGIPMIAHTILSARDAALTASVYVCTEDDEIAHEAMRYGASVFRIPASMAGDLVSSTEPCLALHESLQASGDSHDYIFNLQPTSPLRTAEDIVLSFETLQRQKTDFLVSVTPIDPHYFHWALIQQESRWRMYFGKEFLKERPLLPPVFRPNGAIKLARADALERTRNFFGDSLATYEMPEIRSIHVATDFDLMCVRGIVEAQKIKGGEREPE